MKAEKGGGKERDSLECETAIKRLSLLFELFVSHDVVIFFSKPLSTCVFPQPIVRRKR